MRIIPTRGAGGNVIERHDTYLKWVDTALFTLRAQISPADLDRLVLTRRYWMMNSRPLLMKA
ncbi:hypothetical protein [Acrocarpospora sp. B8E8]|uniref:hypothetical protein n=1 Tax=Acrocarpospora sp. B8E8 TaxID=3153572 RepID=UPI00325D4CD0